MSDVTETLRDLLERRLRELGQRRGRGESLSLREAWQRLPEDDEGKRTPTYETFRRIRQAGHTNINDETADALATMLGVPVDQVYAAARIPPRLGRFELPSRADALSPGERAAVIGVVEAILDAKSEAGRVDIVRGSWGSGKTGQGLRAVADDGDSADAEQVDELARRDRENHESQQQRDE